METHLRPSLAELIGTFALVFIGAGTICSTQLAFGQTSPAAVGLATALAQGLLYAALLTATVPVSGGFLNPAVTLTLWVFRRLDGMRAVWLIGGQLVGGILAALVLRSMFTDVALFPSAPGHGITPHLNVDAFRSSADYSQFKALLSGIGIEIVLTFILTFAIYGTMLDPRAPRIGGGGVGLALTAIVLFGFPLTGAAVNPARWLGPALWELPIRADAFRDHTVYWIGPVFGALLAGAVYEYLILAVVSPSARTEKAADGTGAPVTSTLFHTKK